MEIFWELFSDLPQEGPGSDDLTMKAISLIPDLPASPAILDIGCGPAVASLAITDMLTCILRHLES